MTFVKPPAKTPAKTPARTPARTLGISTARRIALAAQGFADPRPSGEPSRRHVQQVLSRIQLIQLDSVNVAVRAHYAPLFARLGTYDRALIDDAAWAHSTHQPRLLVEYWAHEASLIPLEDWPLLYSANSVGGAKQRGWWRSYGRLAESAPALVEDVLAVVKERGPIGAGPIEKEVLGTRRREPGAWWNRSEVKKICEWLFGIGELTTGTRRGFERLYDLTERVLPPEVHGRHVDVDEAARQLVQRASRALGLATEPDLRDYYRLRPEASRQAVAELVEQGTLEPVRVDTWRHQAYLNTAAPVPHTVAGRALLCPFDPLIWERARTERLFDFRYRIEIYVPQEQRVHGYYVFPFLLDGDLVARVDVKADRAERVLRVPGAFAEPDVDRVVVADELAAELSLMAQWLGLDGVVVGDRGDLAAPLGAAVQAGS